jgi:hypothetical protein
MTVADLKKQGAKPLGDEDLKKLIEQKSVWLLNNVTGEKLMIIYGALGKGAEAKPLVPAEPGFFTQQFPENQGEMQMRYVGRKDTLPSLTGNPAEVSYAGTAQTYNIKDGKIVTALVGTPIEISVYKVGDKFVGARSNEFGFANYEIIPAQQEVSPLR